MPFVPVPFFPVLAVTIVMLGLTGTVFAQNGAMTQEQAVHILRHAGEWPQPSYISPEQAAEILHFNGKLKVEENAQFGDVDDVSRLGIKAIDNSFDSIRIAVTKGGVIFNEFNAMAKSWQPNSAQDHNPFVSVKLPNGAKGFYDSYGHMALSSPDGRFDYSIEVTISENGRDHIQLTESNRQLVAGLTDKSDHGMKFLTEVMYKVYPLAEKKYQDQVNARAQILQASEILKEQSPSTISNIAPAHVIPQVVASVPKLSQSSTNWPIWAAIAVAFLVAGFVTWKFLHK